jgi:hypothetical protein
MSSDEGATPAWLRDSRPIEVDVSTLSGFAKALRDEVELNFRPHLGRVVDGLAPATAPFPLREDFTELAAAWWAYGDCKGRTADLLQAYADATLELARAAEIVAANYRGTDQLAAAKLGDVQQAFILAAQPPPGGAV